ncbi:MAG: hypothetical protein R2772_08500 [Chitinophagales bacterium]
MNGTTGYEAQLVERDFMAGFNAHKRKKRKKHWF